MSRLGQGATIVGHARGGWTAGGARPLALTVLGLPAGGCSIVAGGRVSMARRPGGLVTQGFHIQESSPVNYIVTSDAWLLEMQTAALGTGEDWLLCLFNADIVPATTDTAATYLGHECTFDGYARKLLPRKVGPGGWTVPIMRPPGGTPPWSPRPLVAYSQATLLSWICGTTGDTCRGYFVIGATSGRLYMANRWDTPVIMALGVPLVFTPVYEAG